MYIYLCVSPHFSMRTHSHVRRRKLLFFYRCRKSKRLLFFWLFQEILLCVCHHVLFLISFTEIVADVIKSAHIYIYILPSITHACCAFLYSAHPHRYIKNCCTVYITSPPTRERYISTFLLLFHMLLMLSCARRITPLCIDTTY